MKKVDAVFSLLISEIKKVYDNENEAYWNSLESPEKDRFDAICDQLSNINSSFEQGRTDALIPIDERSETSAIYSFDELKLAIEALKTNFPNLPEVNFKKLIYQATISEKIIHSVAQIPDEDITQQFGFFECTLAFPSAAYISNVSTLGSNLAWINPSNSESLVALACHENNVELWYYLAQISEQIDFSISTEILVCPSACLAAKNNAIALLKIYMLTDGKRITSPIEHLASPRNSSINNYDPNLNYAQFSEVVHIMGEYIDRKDALSKYLSIYHVIENFTFKHPIVKLEKKNNGAMFSIREFKSLYKAVETNELDAVKLLIKAAFPLQLNATTIGDEIYSSWKSFIATHAGDLAAIEDFLKKLDTSTTQVTEINTFKNFFSTVLYRIRCSIVHNKETEYHISSENYTDGCRLVLQDFYLPALEELIFLLIAKENDVVWYKNDSIALWSNTA